MLTDREIASLVLLGVCVVVISLIPGVRSFFRQMVGIIFGKHVLPILLMYLVYAIGAIALAAWSRVWALDLLKDTVVVVLLVGLPLLFRAASAKSGVSLVKRSFAETLGVSVLLLFYMNLASLPLIAEITVQLLVIAASALTAFASTQPEQYRAVSKLLNGLLVVIGAGLFIYTTVNLVVTWSQQDVVLILRTLALSVWFPFVLLPFIYVISFYAQAQLVLMMLPFFNDRKKLPIRVRLAILLGFRGSTFYAASFNGEWRVKAGNLRKFGQTRTLMADYRSRVLKEVN